MNYSDDKLDCFFRDRYVKNSDDLLEKLRQGMNFDDDGELIPDSI